MPDRPLVRVGRYGVLGDWSQATCSRCGLLGDAWAFTPKSRNRLAAVAYRHAGSVHDGDVDREGWT
jgi:hypothetical protein